MYNAKKIFICVILFIILLFINTPLSADVVYLKSGIRLEGMILEEKNNQIILEMEVRGDYVPVTFNPEEINKIIKTEVPEADRDKSAEELLQIGNELNKITEFDKAISYCKLAISKKSDYAEGYLALGHCYLNLKMAKEGSDNLRKASVLYYKLQEPLYSLLANINLKLKNTDEAANCLHKAIAQEPGNYNNYFLLGIIYFGKKEYNVTHYYLRKALNYAQDPDTIKVISDWLEKPELAQYRQKED
ncbi:MAG: hypothetical protein V1674_03905 [Candidatus Omnitrophota bacterium]